MIHTPRYSEQFRDFVPLSKFWKIIWPHHLVENSETCSILLLRIWVTHKNSMPFISKILNTNTVVYLLPLHYSFACYWQCRCVTSNKTLFQHSCFSWKWKQVNPWSAGDKCDFVLVCLTSLSMTAIHLLWNSEQCTMNLLTLHLPVHFSLMVSEA